MSYTPPPPPGPPAPPGPPPGGGYGQPTGYGPPPGFYYGPPMPASAPVPHGTRGGGTPVVAVLIGALVGVAVLVGIIVLAAQPPAPKPCPEGQLCPPPAQPTFTALPTGGAPGHTLPPLATPGVTVAPTQPENTPAPTATAGAFGTPVPTPQSNSPAYVGGTVWSSASLGYSFEYDASQWTLNKTDDAFAQLLLGPIEVDVIGYPSSTSVDAALQDIYTQTDNFIIGRSEDTTSYNALLGPEIGFVGGKGAVFSGTFKNADGTPGDPAGITIMAATQGKATVVVVVLVHNPDNAFGTGTLDHAARKTVDTIIKTFVWGGG